MEAVLVYGIREYDSTYILNVEFIKKFNIDIFCLSYDNTGDNIIYGIKININQIKEGVKKSNKLLMSIFKKYIKEKFNKSYEEPIISVAFYNVKINKKDFKLDYNYKKISNTIKYIISAKVYIKYFRHSNGEEIAKLEEIFKINSIHYGYKINWIQFNNASCLYTYNFNIGISIIGDKLLSWIEKIKKESSQIATFENIKIIRKF